MLFDLHCHIIPGTDDGAKDEETACAMLRAAAAQGIGVIAATSHYSETFAAPYEASFETIRAHAEKLGIRLLRGCEYDLRYLSGLTRDKIITIGEKTNYILVDMNQPFIPHSMCNLFFELKLLGCSIVFAHPERMLGQDGLRKLLKLLADNDIFIQVDTGSITGRYGSEAKRNAFIVLDSGVTHLLGNDAHKPHHFLYPECRAIIERRYGPGVFELLAEKNPSELLNGGQMIPMPARPPFFARLRKLLSRGG